MNSINYLLNKVTNILRLFKGWNVFLLLSFINYVCQFVYLDKLIFFNTLKPYHHYYFFNQLIFPNGKSYKLILVTRSFGLNNIILTKPHV